MALNSPFYNIEQIKKILKMLRQFQKIGLNGVVVADIGLILAIKKNFPNLEIHISCVAACLNSQSIKFYQTIDASRIILPRSLDIAEIESIRRENRKVKLEAIITTKDCLNIDGLCTHLHANDNTTAPCTEEINYSKRIKTKVARDSYLRLYYLYLIGIDYIKFPRRGETAEEMLNKNNFAVTLINRLSRVKPKSISEIKEYYISK
jgi:collagenase-like PrtC family protease